MKASIRRGARKARGWPYAAAAACIGAGAALAGCGGGGGDSGSNSAPATLDVAAAYKALTQSSRTAPLAGSNDQGHDAVGVFAVGPVQAAASTPLGTVDIAPMALTVTLDTGSGTTDAEAYWFPPGRIEWLARLGSDNSCSLPTSYTTLPTSAALGASGTHIEAKRFGNCSDTSLPDINASSIGTLTETWSYQTVNTVPYFCVDTASYGTFASTVLEVCAQVLDASGSLGTKLQIKTTDLNGVHTTLSN